MLLIGAGFWVFGMALHNEALAATAQRALSWRLGCQFHVKMIAAFPLQQRFDRDLVTNAKIVFGKPVSAKRM
jgi:hypothetical protein